MYFDVNNKTSQLSLSSSYTTDLNLNYFISMQIFHRKLSQMLTCSNFQKPKSEFLNVFILSTGQNQNSPNGHL